MQIPYETSYKIACDRLAEMDINDVAFNSSARLDGDTLLLDFIGETYAIKEKGKNITLANSARPACADLSAVPTAQAGASAGREVRIGEKIIILHYLVTADGTPLQRQEITLQEIAGASFYYPTYKARTIDLIVNRFSNTPSDFIAAAQKIGFAVTQQGGFYRLKSLVLPNIPITFIIWKDDKGNLIMDKESVKILYDYSISHYLPLEDIIVLTEFVCHKMIKWDDPQGHPVGEPFQI